MFSGKRTKQQYFNDFTSVVLIPNKTLLILLLAIKHQRLVFSVQRVVGFALFNGVIYSLDKSIKQKFITVTKRYKKKSTKLWKEKRLIFGENTKCICYKVHNFSSYQLSCKEVGALSFGLNEHITDICNGNKPFTKIEMFYLKDISHLNNNVINGLKTNFDTHVINIGKSKSLTTIAMLLATYAGTKNQ